MSSYRFVVLVDIEDAPNLAAAYGKLYDKLIAAGLEWESTDEAFGPDGEEIPADQVVKARMDSWGFNSPEEVQNDG